MTLIHIPNSAEAYSDYGHMLKEDGRLDEAVESYRQALALKPDYAEAYGDLGNVFKEQGRPDKAIDSYLRALALKPDYAKAYINLGVVLHEGGLLDEAAAQYKRALAIKSDYVAAHFNLGALHMSLGQTEEALHAFRQALNFKPDLVQASHMIAVLEGITTESAPHEYIKNLFNHYANHFENHLLNKLEYKIPQILFTAFRALISHGTGVLPADHPPLACDQGRPIRHAIDLGCGTGLAGELFQAISGRLSGVDLSDKMLAIARDKRVYTDLHQADIVTFLNGSDEFYDLFLATDVFVYVGELEGVFAAVRERSLPGAYFAFSTEWMAGAGFVLQKSARFAHGREYIRSLCQRFGFRVVHCQAVNLRKEKEEWIRGDIFIVRLAANWQ